MSLLAVEGRVETEASAAFCQLVGKANEGRQIQLFGTQAAIHIRRCDGVGVQQPLEGVAQGLAPLVERLAHYALQLMVIARWMRQRLMWHQANDRRIDLWRRRSEERRGGKKGVS